MTIHSPALASVSLMPFVGGDPCTDERRGLLGAEAGGHMRDIIRIGENVLGEATVLGVAAELRLRAYRLPGRQAMLAMTAGRIEPRHAHTVTLFDDRHARPNGGDQSDALMAGNEGKRRLQRPVALGGMKIGVAYPAGLGLDKDLARSDGRDIDLAATLTGR